MNVTLDKNIRILSSNLYTNNNPHSVVYSLKTTRGVLCRKITTLSEASVHSPAPTLVKTDTEKSWGKGSVSSAETVETSGEPLGMINWKERWFELGGMRKSFKDIKRREGNRFTGHRVWKWNANGKEYALGWTHHTWDAFVIGTQQKIGTFEPYRPRLFSKSIPPKLNISPSASHEEVVFLTLIFLFSEVKRQERKQHRRRAVMAATSG